MGDAEVMEGKKLQIVERAFERFYEGGFHATGIDAVMADSGISKRTLYKYFSSKEELIEAVLDYYTAGFVADLFQPVEAVGDDARAQITAFFDVRKAMIDREPTRGCLGMKAAQEYAGKHDGITVRGRRATLEAERRFIEMCERAGYRRPVDVGRQINILFQGALLLSQVSRESSPFASAKAAVETLLAEAEREPA